MLSLCEAISIARAHVARKGDLIALIDEPVAFKAYGWVFAYDSQEFLAAGDETARLVGQAPFLVLRQGGDVLELSSLEPVDTYLMNYELTGDPLSKPEPRLYVFDWMLGMNGVGAVKLLHDVLGLEIKESRAIVKACIDKFPIKLTCKDLDQAYRLQENLAGFGFVSRFAPNL